MIVTLELTSQSRRKIDRDVKLAGRSGEVFSRSMQSAVYAGAEDIRKQLVMGELGLTMRNPGSGMAASMFGWILDEKAPLGAVGIPSNSPAAAYANILEHGGTIYPKNAKALAVPVSDKAKRYSSPRDMDNLSLIPRKGKPALLVEKLSSRGRRRAHWIIHWVLVGSVTIAPRRWLSRGAEAAKDTMSGAFRATVMEMVNEW